MVSPSAAFPPLLIRWRIERRTIAQRDKALRDLRIRGAYHRGHAKYILMGSFDGFTWHRLHSLRGASFKLFRLVIVTTLAAAERISWVEVDYQTRFANRLR